MRPFEVQCLAALMLTGLMGTAAADTPPAIDRQLLGLELMFVQGCVLTHAGGPPLQTLASREGWQELSDPDAWAIFVGTQGGDAWKIPSAAGKSIVIALHRNEECNLFANGFDPAQAASQYETLVTSLAKGDVHITKSEDSEKDTKFGKELNEAWVATKDTSPGTKMTFGMTTYSGTTAPFQFDWRYLVSQH